jgi:hypothetical protein
MTPDEPTLDEESPVDEFRAPRQPADFSQARPDTVLSEYDGTPLSYLARGPRVSEGHAGSWLMLLRSGGPLYRAVIPSDVRERWLAVPLSEIRRKQADEGHISLLEVIGFTEWRPYVLTGADPFGPADATRLPVRQIPHSYFPSGLVSIHGSRIEGLQPLERDPLTKLAIHLVPGKREIRLPSLWDVGSVEHALEQFIETTQPFRRIQSQGAADIDSFGAGTRPAGGPLGEVNWVQLGVQGAKLGTLVLDLDMGTASGGGEPGIRRALPELAPIAVDPTSETLSHASQEPTAGRTALALLTLGSVLEAVGMSALLAWKGDQGSERVLLSPLSAHEGTKALTSRAREEFGSGSIRAPTVRVTLSSKEAEPLNRPADPSAGGFESLLADLKAALNPVGDSFELSLRPDQVERVVRYVQSYGGGGAQERLRPVYEQLRRLGPSFGLLR